MCLFVRAAVVCENIVIILLKIDFIFYLVRDEDNSCARNNFSPKWKQKWTCFVLKILFTWFASITLFIPRRFSSQAIDRSGAWKSKFRPEAHQFQLTVKSTWHWHDKDDIFDFSCFYYYKIIFTLAILSVNWKWKFPVNQPL